MKVPTLLAVARHRGTEISNPFPSSKESANHRFPRARQVDRRSDEASKPKPYLRAVLQVRIHLPPARRVALLRSRVAAVGERTNGRWPMRRSEATGSILFFTAPHHCENWSRPSPGPQETFRSVLNCLGRSANITARLIRRRMAASCCCPRARGYGSARRNAGCHPRRGHRSGR